MARRLESEFGSAAMAWTRYPWHATQLTRDALSNGYETIVSVGGDGTLNEVVNGFFVNGKQINTSARLGIISTGTGADFAKTIGLARGIDAGLDRLSRNSVKRCDVGRVTSHSTQNVREERYFINVADAGFGGVAAAFVNRGTKAFGGPVSYLLGLVKTLAVYRNHGLHIKVNNDYDRTGAINSVIVANGQYFGGGMWIAPQALLDDGAFEIIIIGNVSNWEILANTHRLYKGTITDHPKVTSLKGTKISLHSDELVAIEADGEIAGTAPVTFELVPGAINLVS